MKRFFYLIAAFFALTTFVQAADSVRMIEDFSSKVESADGHFVQHSVEDGKVVATGRFSFARPGKFLWETLTPFKQTILCDGKTLWIYDPDLNQVTIRELHQTAGLGPAALLFGKASPREIFNLTDLKESQDLFWVRATPKETNAAFSVMEVGLDAKGFVRELRLTDSFGETTLYELKALDVPSRLQARDFVLQIPPGADVLNDTSMQ